MSILAHFSFFGQSKYSMKQITFSGRVETGEGFATRLGCPTANIAVEQGVVIPGMGAYVGEASFEGEVYPSLIFITDGRTGYHLKMEVHLLNQNLELFGKHMRVVVLEKLRDVVDYPGEEKMAEIIAKDIEVANEWFEQKEA
jgi:riboflavin kinase / FMN adenylyltransferase